MSIHLSAAIMPLFHNPNNLNNMRLEQKIAKILSQRGQTLSIAESCTGGLVCQTLTSIPGASTFLRLGVVAYSNAAKTRMLKVPAKLIRTCGAVSPSVAKRMATGVRRILDTDFGLSVTGIAGPSGGTKNRPVGLTYVGVCNGSKVHVQEFHFKGSRQNNMRQAKTAALTILAQMLAQPGQF